MRILLIIAAVVASVGLLVLTAPEKTAALRETTPDRVEVVQILPVDVQPTQTVTGHLQPLRKAQLRFEVHGQVEWRDAEPGQPVAEGASLLTLDAADYRDALADAEARLALHRAELVRDRQLLDLAQKNSALQADEVKRLERLGEDSLASRSQRGEARQRLQQLEAEAVRLRHSVDTAGVSERLLATAVARARRDLQRCTIRAPFAGQVNTVQVDVGDVVAAQQLAVELVDTRFLEFYAEVSTAAAAALELGATIEVAVGDRRLQGELIALQPEPDSRTHTYPLRIRVPGAGLMPGLLARAELRLRPLQAAVVVPVAAVLREDGAAHVFVVVDGKLEKRGVQLGVRDGNRFVVSAGLQAGETLVAGDVAALSDGQPVVVSTAATAAP